MPVDKSIVDAQLEQLGDFYRFFTSKELRHLPEVLTEGEVIHGVTSGYYESKTWIIVITSFRLLFLDKSMLYGLKQVDIPLSQISSVSHKTGFFFGEITIATSAGSQVIGTIAKKDVTKICSIISGLIHGGKKQAGASPAPTSIENLSTQLERLFVLREKGALTESEYTAFKERLLDSELFKRPNSTPK